MKRQDYIKATQAAIINQPKYWAKHHNDRVTADGGIVTDETPVGQRSHLTDYYKFLRETRLIDSLVFSWDGSAGIKTRTSGVNQYANKLYDMSASNNDAVQAIEANQPHTSGYIAPNEQRKLKGLTGETGTKGLTGTDIQIASSGTFTLVIAVKWNYPGTSSRIYLSATNYIELTDSAITLRGDSGNVLTCSHNFRTGLTEILTFEYSNGAGLIRVNGAEKTTTATSGAVTFGSLFLNQTSYNFDGEIGKLQIANIRLSASQIQNLYNFTRLQHLEIEGINIGNQHWATSNYEGVVTGNGTVIPEVQESASVEKVLDGDFESISNWSIYGSVVLSQVEATRPDGVGTYALRASGTGTQFGARQLSRLTTGRVYRVRGWARSDGNQIPRVWVGGNRSKWSGTTSTDWQYFDFKTYADGEHLFLTSGNASTGYLEWDDVSFLEEGWADLTTPAWCYYGNDPLNGTVYGKKYNLYGAQAINLNAPTGYAIGTYAQWLQMVTLLGGTSIAGNKMKLNGTALWAVGNLGTNESGFTALPNGQRNADGTFSQINNKANFWTSDGYLVTLDYNAATVTFTSGADAKIGAAVRLLRNEPVGATERTIETGYITNALGATNLDIPIPFGYQVESVRIDSETNITGLSAKLFTGGLVELETLFTAKSVTANVQKVIAADADQSIHQTDPVVRINGTKADTTKRFRVWIKLTKVVFS